mmetsp:Transcript_60935/g.51587  ORF Transcript_60935/g.51587 Transcript_60935/m.51587 type:complete len:212 (+) Transcript_60935:122-757(+)
MERLSALKDAIRPQMPEEYAHNLKSTNSDGKSKGSKLMHTKNQLLPFRPIDNVKQLNGKHNRGSSKRPKGKKGKNKPMEIGFMQRKVKSHRMKQGQKHQVANKRLNKSSFKRSSVPTNSKLKTNKKSMGFSMANIVKHDLAQVKTHRHGKILKKNMRTNVHNKNMRKNVHNKNSMRNTRKNNNRRNLKHHGHKKNIMHKRLRKNLKSKHRI